MNKGAEDFAAGVPFKGQESEDWRLGWIQSYFVDIGVKDKNNSSIRYFPRLVYSINVGAVAIYNLKNGTWAVKINSITPDVDSLTTVTRHGTVVPEALGKYLFPNYANWFTYTGD